MVPVNRKRPTSQDVANLAGVSRATVSAYLNKTSYVSPELVTRIEKAIRELGYIPDPLARALKMKVTKTIGLIIPVLSQFYTPMIRAINDVAHQNNYDLLLSSSEEDAAQERKLLEVFVSKRVGGILLGPCSEKNRDLLADIQRSGTHVAQVNRRIPGLEIDSVISDTYQAAYRAAEHLIQRGRRHIAYLGYDPTTLCNVEKKDGYLAALYDHGVADGMVIQVKEHNGMQIAEALNTFLDAGRDCDALICSTQGKTAIALRILRERGIDIPGRMALLGFDDTPWSEMLGTPLTMVSEATYRMGEEAIRLLLQRIHSVEPMPPAHLLLGTEFIIRQST
jgi:DNA-binding LacI/PurR family transcriptional regulator